jgi:hypothetical protein
MKKLLSITAIFLMFLVGCSNEQNNITAPTTGINELSKGEAVTTSFSEPIVSVSQLIDGAVGGWITLSKSYLNEQGRLMSVDASVFFPQGSFEGQTTITMTADFSSASIEFYPSMQFNKWLSLNLWYQNLSLNQMGYGSNDKVDFVYFDDDGNTYPIVSKSVSMNYHQGSLKVNNAWLNHFSRYGFVRSAF